MPIPAVNSRLAVTTPAWQAPTLVNFTTTVLRGGEPTGTPKQVRFYDRAYQNELRHVVTLTDGHTLTEVLAGNSAQWYALVFDDPGTPVVGTALFRVAGGSVTLELEAPAQQNVTDAQPLADPYAQRVPPGAIMFPRERAVRRVNLRVTVLGAYSSRRSIRLYTDQYSQISYWELRPSLELLEEEFTVAVIDGQRLTLLVMDDVNGESTACAAYYVTITGDVELVVDLSPLGRQALQVKDYPARPQTFIHGSKTVRVPAPAHMYPPLRTLTMQVTREGNQTPNRKIVKLFTSELSTTPIHTFWIVNGFELSETFLASAVDGARFIQAIDEAEPMVGSIRWPVFSQDVTMRFNLSEGAGGSGPTGDDARFEAVVRVNNMPANREVVVVQREIDGKWSVVGTGVSGPTGVGNVSLKLLPDAAIYALAVDNWGRPFQAGLSVSAGETIRPSTYVGWVYEITEAGTLPAEEPEWWVATDVNPARALGTAQAVAVRYYRPLAHGPVPVELT